MRDDQVLAAMPPPFSPSDPSPVLKQVLAMATQVKAMFTAHPHHVDILNMKGKIPPSPIEPSEVFYAVGSSGMESACNDIIYLSSSFPIYLEGATRRQKDDEIRLLTQEANVLVKEAKEITPEVICNLHSCILLEGGAESGQYRNDVTVGSYMKMVRGALPWDAVDMAFLLTNTLRPTIACLCRRKRFPLPSPVCAPVSRLYHLFPLLLPSISSLLLSTLCIPLRMATGE